MCLAFGGLILIAVATTAEARSRDAEMKMLDPSERIEQRCNTKAMGEVGRDHKGMKPDELVAYAYSDTHLKGPRIKAPGAAIRSGRTWYHLSYDCLTEHDGMDVKTFSYKLGSAIPDSEWSHHYLVAP
ncbi:DUF930 domain-containing protein [Ancylobacter mangrovi]|uniref:DUF930 domain-containing protein n=1 Tax=Ancylobacter mangrovi TaxID=2972472 RepID=A0A9X2T3P9_9HYPH|nr:DUF930 domain-containing protein [Ancylobacter mangrovi]MCS0497377.1 DUF930 domain-containing protein [Ancylobacter mangrovi]MCS0504072.1 DUF930 domain-containing protein [Ancylobacter mangrovi]